MTKNPELIKVLIVEAGSVLAMELSATLEQYGYAIAVADAGFISSMVQPDSDPEVNSPAPVAAKQNGQDAIDNEIILRQGSYIFVKRNFQFVKISLSEILYMEADGNYVHIIVKDRKFTVRLSLMQVIRKIHYSRFARINRSVVVNVDAIQSFNKEQVVIAQHEISIGRNYKESFFRQLGFR